MHLLMETAMGDSKRYQVLSYEEIEDVKKELAMLTGRIDATKRKLALENKIREAASSMNRLPSQSTRDSVSKGHRRSNMSKGSMNDLESDLAASTMKCEDLAQELWKCEKRMQDLQRRLLEHTAGVLQMTHKGYLEKDMQPQSPDDPLSLYGGGGSLQLLDGSEDFEDHSFYRALDTVLESDGMSNGNSSFSGRAFALQNKAILDTQKKLEGLNQRLRDSIVQVTGRQPPQPPRYQNEGHSDPETALQEQVDYLEQGLHAVQSNHQDLSARSVFNDQKNAHYENFCSGLWTALQAGDNDALPAGDMQQDGQTRGSPASQEDFSLPALSAKVQSLHKRSKDLHDQKDILSRQVQQQRELNSKSDTQKDMQVTNLTAELEQARHSLTELAQRLESERQDAMSRDQQRDLDESNALKAQRDASRETQERLYAELQSKQDEIARYEAQSEAVKEDQAQFEANEASLRNAMKEKETDALRAHNEMKDLEGEVIRLQTEVTIARAELDGAYGTRAQRAAEVATNAVGQQQFDELTERNNALVEEISALKTQHENVASGSAEMAQRAQDLQRELSETITEYEAMTKASIEFEKEREQLENSVDAFRDRCEGLEVQLSDEKVKGLGMKSPGGRDSQGSTSTMVLKNEFKKMMRETRAENMKTLRVNWNLNYPGTKRLTASSSMNKRNGANWKLSFVR